MCDIFFHPCSAVLIAPPNSGCPNIDAAVETIGSAKKHVNVMKLIGDIN